MDQQKVYIVLEGIYEQNIVAVYSNEDLAYIHAEAIDEGSVEAHSICENDEYKEKFKNGLVPYDISGYFYHNCFHPYVKVFSSSYSKNVEFTEVGIPGDMYKNYMVNVEAATVAQAKELAEEKIRGFVGKEWIDD